MLSFDIARIIHADREREIRELVRIRTLLRDQATDAADRAERRAHGSPAVTVRPAPGGSR